MLKRNSGGTVSPKQRNVCVSPNTLNPFASSQNCSAAVSLGDAIGLCYTSFRCSLIVVQRRESETYATIDPMASNIFYKYPQFLIQSNDSKFDELHEPGVSTPYSGIYRCEGCGKEVTSVSPHPLPPQNHHQHTVAPGRIRWQLVVWG